ncbi:hypothetical protein LshimejAT787_1401720 [Lyophyllum shimeji]|uniref:Uncharacterized protein n=1 Tax=Lyophyllum shimeji TaxID=47721 RepID=A0A9P3UTJ1_LYOSH|nr:hypothetical protein LshimejAT787_1401720 [Lyophyllum shimeji]
MSLLPSSPLEFRPPASQLSPPSSSTSFTELLQDASAFPSIPLPQAAHPSLAALSLPPTTINPVQPRGALSLLQAPINPSISGFYPSNNDAYTYFMEQIRLLSNENHRVKDENVQLKAKIDATEKNYDMLLTRVNELTSQSGNTLQTFRSDPPPLNEADYPLLRFWHEKTFNEFAKLDDGDTDGLAVKKPKRGRPAIDDDDDKHPYLETKNGTRVDRLRLRTIGDWTRQHFNSFHDANAAPATWGQISHQAYKYFRIEMLTEFEEFRYCDSDWKLKLWASRKYTSWMQNKRRRERTSDGAPLSKKLKVAAASSSAPAVIDLDNPMLLVMKEDDGEKVSHGEGLGTPEVNESRTVQATVSLLDPLAIVTVKPTRPCPRPRPITRPPPSTPDIPTADSTGVQPAPPTGSPAAEGDVTATPAETTTTVVHPTPPTTSQRDVTAIPAGTATTGMQPAPTTTDVQPATLATTGVQPAAPAGSPTSQHNATAIPAGTATTGMQPAPTTTATQLAPLVPPPMSQGSLTATQTATATTSTQPAPSTPDMQLPAERPLDGSSALDDVTNTIATTTTREHERRGKSSVPAVVGTGFTEKNFAMKAWLDGNPGGLKCDFEAFYKKLPAAEKKVYNERAKAAVSTDDIPYIHYLIPFDVEKSRKRREETKVKKKLSYYIVLPSARARRAGHRFATSPPRAGPRFATSPPRAGPRFATSQPRAGPRFATSQPRPSLRHITTPALASPRHNLAHLLSVTIPFSSPFSVGRVLRVT